MAAKKASTSGSTKRAAVAKKRKAVVNRHIGRRGGKTFRTVNAPKRW